MKDKEKIKRKTMIYGTILCLAEGILLYSVGKSLPEKVENYSTMDEKVIIQYADNVPVVGSIAYNDIDKHIKFVTLNHEGIIKKYLMIKDYNCDNTSTRLQYVNIENGVMLISYLCDYATTEEEIMVNPQTIKIGKNTKIVEEESILKYLWEKDIIKEYYDISDLIEVLLDEEFNKYEIQTLDRSRK